MFRSDCLCPQWQMTDLDDFHLDEIDNCHEVKREGVVVGVGRVVLWAIESINHEVQSFGA